ncbi:hypothetical protein ABI214_23120 [Prescottella soli]|uniref:Uncharacterized protein n=1 Tax=Prescottella soli TaxID=1543852 RepID=A0ABW9FT12_9NOCA
MRKTFTQGSLHRRIGIAAMAVAAAGVVAVPGVAWASNGISTGSSGPVAIEQGLPERTGTAPECAKETAPAAITTEAIQISEEEAQKLRAEQSAAEGIAVTVSVPAQIVAPAAQPDRQDAVADATSC